MQSAYRRTTGSLSPFSNLRGSQSPKSGQWWCPCPQYVVIYPHRWISLFAFQCLQGFEFPSFVDHQNLPQACHSAFWCFFVPFLCSIPVNPICMHSGAKCILYSDIKVEHQTSRLLFSCPLKVKTGQVGSYDRVVGLNIMAAYCLLKYVRACLWTCCRVLLHSNKVQRQLDEMGWTGATISVGYKEFCTKLYRTCN